MNFLTQKLSLESPSVTSLDLCNTSCLNQTENSSEKEEATLVKSVLTSTTDDVSTSNTLQRNPTTERGKTVKRKQSPNSKSSNTQRKAKVKSNDSEHDKTLITQRTRILDLENEVNQLRNVLQTFKNHTKHQKDSAENNPTQKIPTSICILILTIDIGMIQVIMIQYIEMLLVIISTKA